MFFKIKGWFIGDYLDKTKDVYEHARITVNFNFLFSSALLLLLAGIIFSSTGVFTVAVGNFIGFGVCILQLIILKQFKNTRLSSFLFVIMVECQLITNLFINKEGIHLGASVWLCMVMLYTVFNLGLKCGAFVTLLNIATLSVFAITGARENMIILSALPDAVFHSVIMESAVGFSLVFYMIYVFY